MLLLFEKNEQFIFRHCDVMCSSFLCKIKLKKISTDHFLQKSKEKKNELLYTTAHDDIKPFSLAYVVLLHYQWIK